MPTCFHYSDEACFCNEDDDGFCHLCDGEGDENGECWNPRCAPAVELGYSPVRASFVIVDGRVSEVALG